MSTAELSGTEGRLSRTTAHKTCGACPSQGDANAPMTTYAEDMSKPWSNLVDTLSGTQRTTPLSWPERRVHRMMDDAPRGKSPVGKSMPVGRIDRRPSLAQVPAPVLRSRCPCRVCQLGLSTSA
jgi:hypothetical protein